MDSSIDLSLDPETVTGIITAEFQTSYEFKFDCSSNKLQFQKTTLDVPLALTFWPLKKIEVLGFKGGQQMGKETFEFDDKMGHLYVQILDISPDHYSIKMVNTDPDPPEVISTEYNYDLTSTWTDFQNSNIRLADTTKITNSGECIVFKYISVCSDATPRLCDTEQSYSTIQADLGQPYTLTCEGSGAPFLSVRWSKDGEEVSGSWESHVTDRATHRVESVVEIEEFAISDVGNWTCTIYNQNFGDGVTKTMEYVYRKEVEVSLSPAFDYYLAGPGQKTSFEWNVTGWPLESVFLKCVGSNISKIAENRSDYHDSNTPFSEFSVTLEDEDQVTCTLQDGDDILDILNITKVGYGCSAGERGVNKTCVACPLGESSTAGSVECSPVQGTCEVGMFGEGEDCKPCPWGTTSPAGAVKIQECKVVDSGCLGGEYGTDNCLVCPPGTTSLAGSVKLEDCDSKVGQCGRGYFGVGSECSPCPSGRDSEFGSAVKEQDCYVRAQPEDLPVILGGAAGGVMFMVLLSVVGVCVAHGTCRRRQGGTG
ncbi:hypothetical protein ACHWQZ_G019429 [Mnemiopsis leidyi]